MLQSEQPSFPVSKTVQGPLPFRAVHSLCLDNREQVQETKENLEIVAEVDAKQAMKGR